MEFEVNKLLPPYLYSDILELGKRVDLNAFAGKTVIITGASSPLGMYLAGALLTGNDLRNARTKIIAVDTSDKIFSRFGKLTYRGDIDFLVSRDYSYFGCDSADFLIHTQNDSELERFEAETNLLSFIESLDISAVLVSDPAIYGEVFNGKSKISENDIYGYLDCSRAESLDAQSQRMVQALAVRLAREKNADIKLAVMSQIYGAGTQHYYEIFRNVQGNRSVTADCSELERSVIYVADAAAALFTVLLKGKSGEIYNIASDDVLSPVILADKCSEFIYGGELKVIHTGKQATLSYMASNLSIFDNQKLKSIGFEPEVDLRSGIVRTLNIMSEKGGEA